jgi:hypothetical protein
MMMYLRLTHAPANEENTTTALRRCFSIRGAFSAVLTRKPRP